MKLSPSTDPPFSILEVPELCPECHTGSRLSNGLCLSCLLHGALDDDPTPTGKEIFKEVLAAVRSRDGDWSIGDHDILDEIARGAMGVIYRAREPHSGRIVALKCILAFQGDPDQALARFRREAETAARLEHPNIVPIYHVGETADASPFFTMKYAANGSLLKARHLLGRAPRAGIQLMAKVARAVQYAHEQGVLHRDLKPGNILLDGRGEPLVSDFGLARCGDMTSHLTVALTGFGTPGYMSPEQADGPASQLTAAADIYALGAILFELLTGRLPFQGDTALGVMKQSADKPAPKLRTLAPQLDRDLETICARCLERDPSARYRSAESLAQDLENWLEGRPIAARPIGLVFRSRQWVRGNRRLAALLGAFLVLAIASAAWQIHNRRLQSAMRESLLASRSVVVLPFLDLDKVVPDRSLADSIASSLQSDLNTFGPATVKTTESGSTLGWDTLGDTRRAGQETNARTVLTGTVRTAQGKRRISFRLLDGATGECLFIASSETPGQGSPTKVISTDLARTFYAILSAKDWSSIIQSRTDPGLRNDVAREAIVAGRALMLHSTTTSDCDKAIALFGKVLLVEPKSTLAHAYLSITATARTHYNADRSFLKIGETEADLAISLSPDSSEAHRAKAGVYYQEGKFADALEEELRTIEVGGLEEKVGNFIGQTLDMLGRPHHALNWSRLPFNRARMPGEVDWIIGDCWVKLGNDERALQAYARATELRPDSPRGEIGISLVRLLESDFESAREVWQTRHRSHAELDETDQLAAQIEFFARNFQAAEELYLNLARSDADGGGSFWGAIAYESALGRIKQELGDDEGAKIILADCLAKEAATFAREPANPEAAYRLAAVEASLGMLKSAFPHLHQAVALGWIDYRSLSLDPRFDRLRVSSEFQTIVNSL
ncbi:MAG: eukaryotic-like serine/threonine-protein kinase, partial [Verrucomicrobiota bacterium]